MILTIYLCIAAAFFVLSVMATALHVDIYENVSKKLGSPKYDMVGNRAGSYTKKDIEDSRSHVKNSIIAILLSPVWPVIIMVPPYRMAKKAFNIALSKDKA